MVEEERTPDTRNGSQTGFYPGGLYHYGKKFFVPEEWENETVILELEGAYMNARVYVNGDYAGDIRTDTPISTYAWIIFSNTGRKMN